MFPYNPESFLPGPLEFPSLYLGQSQGYPFLLKCKQYDTMPLYISRVEEDLNFQSAQTSVALWKIRAHPVSTRSIVSARCQVGTIQTYA